MTDSAVAVLRAELLAAKGVLAPQLRGLNDIVASPAVSGEAVQLLNDQLGNLHRRADVIDAALSALDALDGDDYPDRPRVEIPQNVLAELIREQDDVGAAVAIFRPLEAANIAISLGQPQPKS